MGQLMPNLHLIRQQVDTLIADAPLDIVILPEIFDGQPTPTDGKSARQFLQTLARTCNTHVIGGSCLIVDDDGSQRNVTHVVHRSGDIVGRYDKRILFSVESDTRQPGDSVGLFQLDDFRVGVLICADLWHPELARELYSKIDLLAVPVKSSVPTEKNIEYARSLWHALALTRAMENGFAVAVSDWPESEHVVEIDTGQFRTRQTHFTSGASCIADPSHRPNPDRVQRLLKSGQPGHLRTDINLAKLAAFRDYRTSVGLLPTTDPPSV